MEKILGVEGVSYRSAAACSFSDETSLVEGSTSTTCSSSVRMVSSPLVMHASEDTYSYSRLYEEKSEGHLSTTNMT